MLKWKSKYYLKVGVLPKYGVWGLNQTQAQAQRENPRCQKYEAGSDLHISAVHEPFGISIGSSL